MYQIALAMMIKDEEGYIIKSLNSIKSIINTIVIYDTGSTDGTISEVHTWCAALGKKLHLKCGEFEDFASSRNILLDYAEKVVEEPFILLLDANDEIKGDGFEISKLGNFKGALVQQIWKDGDTVVKFWNPRLIRTDSGYRYKGVVHEYLVYNSFLPRIENFFIEQDRAEDGNKSQLRLHKDRELLIQQVRKESDDARSIFYLARTCKSLGFLHEALEYYKMRLDLSHYFKEEIMWCYIDVARIMLDLNLENNAIENYWRAFEVLERVEPLIDLAILYFNKGLPRASRLLLEKAATIELTGDEVLFVEQNYYTKTRWELLDLLNGK